MIITRRCRREFLRRSRYGRKKGPQGTERRRKTWAHKINWWKTVGKCHQKYGTQVWGSVDYRATRMQEASRHRQSYYSFCCIAQETQSVLMQSTWDITFLVAQPPISPGFNLNGLGLFRSIRSLRYYTPAKTEKSLIDYTIVVFDADEPRKLCDLFLTWQKCLEYSMKTHLRSNYPLPSQERRDASD